MHRVAVATEEALDGLGLRRRFDDHERLRPRWSLGGFGSVGLRAAQRSRHGANQSAYRRPEVVPRERGALSSSSRSSRIRERSGRLPAPSCSPRVLALSLDPKEIIESTSARTARSALMLIIFAETGLLIGFFLPGDSLLFTAGLLANQGKLNLAVAARRRASSPRSSATRSAITIGKKAGPVDLPQARIPGSSSRSTSSAPKTFFDKHGPKTIVLARFVPGRAHVRAGARRRRRDERPHVHDLQRGRRVHLGVRRDARRLRARPTRSAPTTSTSTCSRSSP